MTGAPLLGSVGGDSWVVKWWAANDGSFRVSHASNFCLAMQLLNVIYCTDRDVTNTGNGERGTGNGEPGTGVWELMYSGNPLENSKWRDRKSVV